MFEIFIKTHFSAAHYLRNYPGNCEHLHGHNWDVEVVVGAEGLNEIDVGIDFRDLKKSVHDVLAGLDHTNLNDHPAFKAYNPSSERLAEYIYKMVKGVISGFKGVRLLRVTVCETPMTGVTYVEP
ncbi:MAG: 6-carboxytetrahydropterin synthase QueD [Dissulfurimicrobium sp.]|uniref:6-carboxytetrahydropterin synthase QueD n=1 Tax=Dissulfurimicrobium TaxID=1769732 RepID=UPI001EDB868F|nr:6-carboxytetrahydropterin synthase QueD [Dissulfurimicrobium hydrothermale]UKL13828.1 6-carboxytetrahydropterin synthase QueD [Dissulfurimicrobium hydrothermale]